MPTGINGLSYECNNIMFLDHQSVEALFIYYFQVNRIKAFGWSFIYILYFLKAILYNFFKLSVEALLIQYFQVEKIINTLLFIILVSTPSLFWFQRHLCFGFNAIFVLVSMPSLFWFKRHLCFGLNAIFVLVSTPSLFWFKRHLCFGFNAIFVLVWTPSIERFRRFFV